MMKSKAVTQTPGIKPTHMRYVMVMLLFVGASVNYLDRTNISVVASEIKEVFHLDAAMLGLVFSAFGWTYALAQIPGGWILDRFGPKKTYGTALIIWSIATLLQGFATGFAFLILCRLMLGLFEAPASPTNSRVVATWFPTQERARATGIWTAGQFVGLAFLTPLLFWIHDTAGWRVVFYATGGAGLLWAVIWFLFYKEPDECQKTNDAERALIRGGEYTENTKTQVPFNLASLSVLFRHRQLLGIYVGQFCIVTTLWFFLTWFPTYLATEKHITVLHNGFWAMIPYVCAFLGVLVGGAWSDIMVKKGYQTGTARKTPVVIGLLMACLIIIGNYTSSTFSTILVMSVAFFGQGMSNLTWTLVSDIAPRQMLGTAGGVFNFIGNTASIVTPMVIGFIVSSTGNFSGALLYVGIAALIGALSYIFLIGQVSRIVLSEQEINDMNPDNTEVRGA